jgi:hypothetical protein
VNLWAGKQKFTILISPTLLLFLIYMVHSADIITEVRVGEIRGFKMQNVWGKIGNSVCRGVCGRWR